MKQFFIVISFYFILIISCKNNYQQRVKISTADHITFDKMKNDTTCIKNLPSLKDEKILLLNACSVVHNDSSSLSLQFKVANGKLDKQYNFQVSSNNYTRIGDTIIVKYIYTTWCRGVEIRPLSINVSNDTLIINESIDWSGCSTRTNESKAEEFYYTFLLKERIPNLIVRRVGNARFGNYSPLM